MYNTVDDIINIELTTDNDEDEFAILERISEQIGYESYNCESGEPQELVF